MTQLKNEKPQQQFLYLVADISHRDFWCCNCVGVVTCYNKGIGHFCIKQSPEFLYT